MTDPLPEIHPVLLCGGEGTRLWPQSRKSYPKQFWPLAGEESLFQESARRLSGPGFAPPVLLTGEPFRFIVTEQLEEIGTPPAAILIEPAGRNTAAPILAAALSIAAQDPKALILAAPSDHVIKDHDRFRDTLRAAVDHARQGDLVTFGITPTRPETGYGYLELAEGADPAADHPQPLRRFVEKPDAARAAQMLAAGNYLWNAGIFLFTAQGLIDAYQAHAPAMLIAVRAALSRAKQDLGFIRLDSEAWAEVENISIDYAIMEKSANLVVMPFDGGWSDLGDWGAVWQQGGADAQGNVCSDHASAIDCQGSLLHSAHPGLELVGIGLQDMIAVAMPDAVLIAPRHDSQRVKEAVTALKARQAPQATEFPRVHRPWGWFESLSTGDRFQVKRIVVNPGGILSLQSHHHRAEHWIVVKGTAKVTCDDAVQLVTENQSIYIPLGAKHRLENPGKVPMILIEVQTGSYLGEDDIIRYEDLYARETPSD